MFTKDMYRCYVTSSKSLFVTFILQGSVIPIARYFLRNPYCEKFETSMIFWAV